MDLNFVKIIVFSLLLQACQNTAKLGCEDTNWRQQAYVDALKGVPIDKFTSTQQYCHKNFGIEIQSEMYKEGYDLGLAKLCTRSQGFEFGAKGKEYFGTCKESDEEGFLKAYRSGRLKFLSKLSNQLNQEIQESEGRVWRKQNEYELEANSNPQAAREIYDVLESYRAELLKLQNDQLELKTRIQDLTRLLN